MENLTTDSGNGWSRLRTLFSIDARALGVFRIGLAIGLIFDLVIRLTDRERFFSENGLLTLQEWKDSYTGSGYWSLHNLFGATETWFYTLSALSVLFYMLLLAGKFSRIAAVASFILLVSAQYRNPTVIHPADHFLRLLLLWGMLLPMGRRLSLDAKSRRNKGIVLPDKVSGLAAAGLLWQIASGYLFAGLLRQGPEWFQEGSALHYILSSGQWSRSIAEGVIPFSGLLRVFTYISFALQFLIPVLLFFPWQTRKLRIAGIVAAVLIQVSCALFLYQGPWPYYQMLGLILFVPFEIWDKLFGGKEKVALDQAAFAPRTAPKKLISQGIDVLALALLLYCTTWNLGQVPQYPLQVPDELKPLGFAVGAQQMRPYFAPSPPRTDGWPVLGVRLRDKRDLDLLRGASHLDTVHRAPRGVYYKNFRQFQHMQYLADTGSNKDRYRLVISYVRPWNKSHPADKDYIKQAHLAMVEQTLTPPGTPGPSYRKLRIIFSLFFGKQPWHEKKKSDQ